MSMKDERRAAWQRKKSNKNKKQSKSGFVSGNARFQRSKLTEMELAYEFDNVKHMGRSSEAA
ncbi:MAG: hypothetical protein ACYSW3_22505 [Planctomycetota bacterium]|jgi:hypothetical protein